MLNKNVHLIHRKANLERLVVLTKKIFYQHTETEGFENKMIHLFETDVISQVEGSDPVCRDIE